MVFYLQGFIGYILYLIVNLINAVKIRLSKDINHPAFFAVDNFTPGTDSDSEFLFLQNTGASVVAMSGFYCSKAKT